MCKHKTYHLFGYSLQSRYILVLNTALSIISDVQARMDVKEYRQFYIFFRFNVHYDN